MVSNRGKIAPQSHRVSKVRRASRTSARLNPEPGEYAECSPKATKTLQHTVYCVVPPIPTQTEFLQDLSTTPQISGIKRPRDVEDLSIDPTAAPLLKRPRASSKFPEFNTTQSVDRGTSSSNIDPIDYWRKKHTWPREYFEPDDNTMNHLLAKKKSTASLRRKRSDSGSLAASSITPSDQKPREEKSAPYRDARYETLLETKGVYLYNFQRTKEKSITENSKSVCRTLLETPQNVPKDSLFDDDIFDYTCNMIHGRNEAKVIQDISRLLVPSAHALAARSAELQYLTESVNEGWNNSIPLTGTRPQPDYSVGFKRDAFSIDQLQTLSPFIGEFLSGDQSFFMATYYMYFPFFACEVKCGAAALDIADRQNAHSMTLAVRAVVELFRCVKRENEINREVLAFSVSHDHQLVRIYGHYAVIDGPTTTYYRHPIHTYDFTALDGREKWTAYKFTKNLYHTWMPTHFKRICSAIDDLPSELDFDVSSLPQDSGLSQDLESHHLSQSLAESASQARGDLSHSDIGDITPNTSLTQQGASKRPRRKVAK
jgi:hypothetical protein